MCELTTQQYYDMFGEHVSDNTEDFIAQINELINKQHNDLKTLEKIEKE